MKERLPDMTPELVEVVVTPNDLLAVARGEAAEIPLGVRVESKNRARVSHILVGIYNGGTLAWTKCSNGFSLKNLLVGDDSTLPLCRRCAEESKTS